jgi:hypothetical protein
MVEKSGDESIVRVSRAQIRFNYFLAWLLILGAGTYFVFEGYHIILDISGKNYPRWWQLLAAAFPLYVFVLGLKVHWTTGSISKVFVAAGPAGVRVRLMEPRFELPRPVTALPAYQVAFFPVPKLLPEEDFAWNDIGGIARNDDGTATLHAGGRLYSLSSRNCPAPFEVAQLLAERLGVQLPPTAAERKAALTGKKPMPRRKLAARLVRIGLVLFVVSIAAGVIALFSDPEFHAPWTGPIIFVSVFGAAVGVTSLITAIPLFFQK